MRAFYIRSSDERGGSERTQCPDGARYASLMVEELGGGGGEDGNLGFEAVGEVKLALLLKDDGAEVSTGVGVDSDLIESVERKRDEG